MATNISDNQRKQLVDKYYCSNIWKTVYLTTGGEVLPCCVYTDRNKVQPNLDKKVLDKSIELDALDNDLIKADQTIINEKIDKQEGVIKENQIKKDVKNLQNKKPKSNFI